MRAFWLTFLVVAAVPARAQDSHAAPDPVAAAVAEVEAHRINMKVGCSIPVPALWNAPPWEQQAAANRRAAFELCLSDVMYREQDRLETLARAVANRSAAAPNADWSPVDHALDRKWSELDGLAGKLRSRDNWADTAVRILDTFTGPGAPFDTTPRNPYGGYGPYRRDTTTFAPGIR